MKKTDMVKAIAAKAQITQVQAEAVFDAFMDEFTASLAKGDKVQFMGIGSFEVKRRAARVSRNPRTGEAVDVPASNYVAFSSGKKLKDAVQSAKVEEPKKAKKAEAAKEEVKAEEKKPAKKSSAKKAASDKPASDKPAAKKTTAKKTTKKTEEK